MIYQCEKDCLRTACACVVVREISKISLLTSSEKRMARCTVSQLLPAYADLGETVSAAGGLVYRMHCAFL